ncbi:hypothetical protein L249_6955 [Ophiocordyceps polyrhachis-furcata BCC 54312]|uniref:Uncharacterized protein n=1 Tax=Ophiocordyceps polyrhachis-furcata BCC 54312 TaxID=1330021 RepID=A0A367LJP0_9HYPO|nr:hypothetical protein L249_6955 [Ophiocordyceps polyrhachis-furcata BCC 54312]
MLIRRLIILLKKARLAYPVLKRPCPSVTYGGLGPAVAGPASQCLALPPNYSPQRSLTYPTFLPSYGPYGPYGRSRSSVTYGGLGPAVAGPASQCLALPPN